MRRWADAEHRTRGAQALDRRGEGVRAPGRPDGGRLGEDASVGTFDARAVWRTDEDELIYLTYTGRSVIPDPVRAAFADPAAPDVDPARYYLRIAMVFETASKRLEWLNGVLAVGVGERTAFGVRHVIHEIG